MNKKIQTLDKFLMEKVGAGHAQKIKEQILLAQSQGLNGDALQNKIESYLIKNGITEQNNLTPPYVISIIAPD